MEHFTSLEDLLCTECGLNEINVSKNRKLKVLNCGVNNLTSLDLTKNPELWILYCNFNRLSFLDLTKNPKLSRLMCTDNLLTSLDMSKNTQLEACWCERNLLLSLDLSQNTKLDFLWCYKNQLRFLDISKNTKLKNLRCNDNLLTSLDVSKNTLLQSLHCERNYMASESAVVGLNRAVTTEFIFSPQGNLPSEPQNLRAIPDDRTVDLTWTFPAYGGTSTITSFEVSNNNGTSWVTAGNTTSYKFLSLNNGQSYDFKVRAVNSYGRGLEAAISATPYAPRVSPPAAARYGEASSWAIPELNQALDAGLIPLILEGENMTRAISREEFAELAVQLYEKAKGAAIVVTIPNPFTDTTNPQIMKAYQVGVTAGTSATKFSPDTLITREQCATMLYRTIKAIIPGGG